MRKDIVLLICISIIFSGALVPGKAESSNGSGTNSELNVRVERELLTVKVKNAPLESVLKEISKQASIRIVYRAHGEELITVEFSGVPLEKGLKRLSRDVNVAIIYGQKRSNAQEADIIKIIIYSKSGRGSVKTIEPPKKRTARRTRKTPPRKSKNNFIEALGHEDPDVRENAADRLMAYQDDDRFINQLARFFVEEEDEEVKDRVAGSLEDFMTTDVKVRMIKALGKIGGKRVIESLARALDDEDEEVIEAAAEELKKVEKSIKKGKD